MDAVVRTLLAAQGRHHTPRPISRSHRERRPGYPGPESDGTPGSLSYTTSPL